MLACGDACRVRDQLRHLGRVEPAGWGCAEHLVGRRAQQIAQRLVRVADDRGLLVGAARPDQHRHAHGVQQLAVALVLRAILGDVLDDALDAGRLAGRLVALGLRVHAVPSQIVVDDDPEHANGGTLGDRLLHETRRDPPVVRVH